MIITEKQLTRYVKGEIHALIAGDKLSLTIWNNSEFSYYLLDETELESLILKLTELKLELENQNASS